MREYSGSVERGASASLERTQHLAPGDLIFDHLLHSVGKQVSVKAMPVTAKARLRRMLRGQLRMVVLDSMLRTESVAEVASPLSLSGATHNILFLLRSFLKRPTVHKQPLEH